MLVTLDTCTRSGEDGDSAGIRAYIYILHVHVTVVKDVYINMHVHLEGASNLFEVAIGGLFCPQHYSAPFVMV